MSTSVGVCVILCVVLPALDALFCVHPLATAPIYVLAAMVQLTWTLALVTVFGQQTLLYVRRVQR
jgi:hypothetical protein